MRQLSSVDAQFLHVENATTVGHVGSLLLLDPGTAPGGALSLNDLRAAIEPRLHLAAPFRQRLVTVPLGLGRPYWVDDPDFDLEFHLREVALPAPGDDRQLGEQVARIHARPLDRSRPLWEMYLVHDVADGRQAIYSKVHHAAIDGVSGAELVAAVLDVSSEPRVVEPPEEPWSPGDVPGTAERLVRGLLSMVSQPVEVARTLPRTLPHLAELPGASLVPGVEVVSAVADAAVRLLAPGGPLPAARRRTLVVPATPLNGQITAHRRVAFGSLPLSEVKAIKDALGMTVNDVVMAVCATVLRRWLLDHDGLPEVPLVVAVPVSVRASDATGSNQISVMLVALPTQVGDPAERLDAVQAAVAEAKAQFEAVPATILQDVAGAVPTALSGLAAKAAFQLVAMGGLPFNLFVSNVPGPQLPLYVAGARVLGMYPMSAVSDVTGALNITVFSYDGRLDLGLVVCRELVPDVWNLVGYFRDALTELSELVSQ
ncbi:MAG TPA: wax ester/triacylglycerol synthase family O-acyltransferase [Nocardioidaceae bacterium]|nr:wax ester/triacylglycerol synthase family O-acyltransferase [Nocardioidaceae bacterium]